MPHENASPQKMPRFGSACLGRLTASTGSSHLGSCLGETPRRTGCPVFAGHDACNKKAGVAAGFHCYISIAKN
jgi:hypothetical protein